MGDGSWDKSTSRVIIHFQIFTLSETTIMQEILLEKFNVSSYLTRGKHYDPNRGYIIKVPKRDLDKVRALTKDYIYPSLLYKLGL
jgi:hypothetical protein